MNYIDLQYGEDAWVEEVLPHAEIVEMLFVSRM